MRFQHYIFSEADADGMCALSRDLTPDLTISAYTQGVFPWPFEERTVLWASPDPRAILDFRRYHVPKSAARIFRTAGYRAAFNTRFEEVIRACANSPRQGQDGTWITEKIIRAYLELHRAGYAVSYETLTPDGTLAGGLYGIRIGRFFAGESMFHRMDCASKFALDALVRALSADGVTWIDIQMLTPLLAMFGAHELPRSEYLAMLKEPGLFPDNLWQ